MVLCAVWRVVPTRITEMGRAWCERVRGRTTPGAERHKDTPIGIVVAVLRTRGDKGTNQHGRRAANRAVPLASRPGREPAVDGAGTANGAASVLPEPPRPARTVLVDC